MSQPETLYSQEQHIYLTALAYEKIAWANWQAGGDDPRLIAEHRLAKQAVKAAEEALLEWAFKRIEDEPTLTQTFRDNAAALAMIRKETNPRIRQRAIHLALRFDPGSEGKTIAEWIGVAPTKWSDPGDQQE